MGKRTRRQGDGGQQQRKFIEGQPYDKLPPEYKTKPESGAKNKLFTAEMLASLKSMSETHASMERMFGPSAFSFGIPLPTMYEPSFTMPPQHENARCTNDTPFHHPCVRDGHLWVDGYNGKCARCGISRVEASKTCEHEFYHDSRVCRKCRITAREAAYQADEKKRAAAYVPNPDPASRTFTAEEFGELVTEQLDGLVHTVKLSVDKHGTIEALMCFDPKRPRVMELHEAVAEIDLFMSQFEEYGVIWNSALVPNRAMKPEVIPS